MPPATPKNSSEQHRADHTIKMAIKTFVALRQRTSGTGLGADLPAAVAKPT